ncbi:MAG TPA: uracil-DNA glycosylase [Kiritimatiellae bacterium]|nr:uracil-DNA glycosylase [Kiritimatiellia bacterium]
MAALQRVIGQIRELLDYLSLSGLRDIRLPSSAGDRGHADQPDVVLRNAEAEKGLQRIARRIARCRRCPLHESRTRTVPGKGPLRPEIIFVGEGPGAEEDRAGEPFVGPAGHLLTRMIEAMGFAREEVWIGNVVKCRPPGNRTPCLEEMEACLPFLREQIAILTPRVIICLGSTAAKGLLGVSRGITQIRGHWHDFAGIPVMPTFHPAYLLRNPEQKRTVWQDLLAVLDFLGREPPPRFRGRKPKTDRGGE